MKTPPVIDSHCHAGSGDGFSGPWDTSASLETYLRRAGPAGIQKTVLLAPLTSDYGRANDDIGALLRRQPGRFFAFAFVNPLTDRGRIAAMVEKAVANYGFCGIKVHWRDGRMTREIADVARRLQLPVLYDPRGDTATIEMIARAYPDVAWIIPHLSSFADDWKAQLAFVDQLARHPNLFADTSGVRYFDLLADAVRRAGPRKVLFGTDGPFLHPAVELAKIHALELSPDDQALITGGNFLRLTQTARQRNAAR
jgi:uncharacterized protein